MVQTRALMFNRWRDWFVITFVTYALFVVAVNRASTIRAKRTHKMVRTRIPDAVVSVIKLARALGYKYEVIASYFVINQGRIADVMKGRIGPDVPPAKHLPADFPAMA